MIKIGPDLIIDENRVVGVSKGREEDDDHTPYIVFFLDGHDKPIKVYYDLPTRSTMWRFFEENSTIVY